MSITVNLANDLLFAEACGVDLLDGFAGVGGGMAVDIDVAAFGRNSLLADIVMSGADSVAIEALVETGTDGDGAAILVGAAATDTLRADLAVTGTNAAFGDAAPLATGTNQLWTAAVTPAAAFDISVSLVLHRLAIYSALAPAAVGFRTGLAA